MDSESQPSAETALVEWEEYNVSIRALRPKTVSMFSVLLNPPKIISTEKGLPRDWHGLADLVGISGEHMPNLQCDADPTKKILDQWYQKDKEKCTIKKLLSYLEELDRFDVIDDTQALFVKDLQAYKQYRKGSQLIGLHLESDEYVLTRDDVKRFADGLEPQNYDAFVLFADADVDFATKLISKMENDYKLKLCVKDRDLVVGVFEHESAIKLIAERCNRLVAIISSAFLESTSNKFFCSFAQSIGIEQRQSKIVPCLYTPCQVPPELKCYFMLNYQRAGRLWNFWEKLRDSIQTPNSNPAIKTNIYKSASQKIPSISQNTEIKPSSEHDNCLKPKKEGVKFSSMVNPNYPDSDSLIDQNINPGSSTTSLTVVNTQHEKSKTKTGWLKKLLQHKGDKCTDNVTEEVPERHRKEFRTRNFKRKIAVT